MAEWLLLAVLLCPAARAGEVPPEEETLDEELSLQEEGDPPTLDEAEEDDDLFDEFALLEEEISHDQVESASKHRQSIFWSPSAITVLNRKDIQASGAVTLADLLRRVPGIDLYEIKPSYPVLGARALTEESNNLVLTIIDGREAIMEFSGFTLWAAVEVNLDEIERIEVIRGPGSALYGANAYAAVVSITTMRDRPANEARVLVSGGELGHFNLFGKLNRYFDLGDGTLDFGVGLGTHGIGSTSDRFDEMLNVRLSASGYIRYRLSKRLDLNLQAFYQTGTGVFFTHAGDMRIDPATTHVEKAKADFFLGDTTRLKVQLYHAYYEAVFHARTSYRAYDMWVFDFPHISWDTNTVDGQIQFDWEASKDFLLIAGGNVRYTTVGWEKLVITDGTDLRAAGFLQLQWNPWDVLQLVAGLRVDAAPEAEERLALSPRGVAVFRPWENHAFRLGYGLAFRKPSIYESRTHAEIEDFNPAMDEIVDKLAEQFGNEALLNEKVHSFEAGYQTRLLEEKLHLSLDLYYNIYQDTITFVIEVPTRLGVPDIPNSTIQYRNVETDITALGGEFELVWHFTGDWSVWGNLGLRLVTEGVVDEETGEVSHQDRPQEPTLRVNLGGRYFPENGFLVDIALHYVSEYQMPLMDPANLLEKPEMIPLGESFLLIARLGYRTLIGKDQHIEGGVLIRTPLGKDFREYAGIPLKPQQQLDSASDFGGDTLVRLISVYVRGRF